MKEVEENELPHGWTHASLYDFSLILMGQSPPSNTYNASGNGLPFYQGKTEFGNMYPVPAKYCSVPNRIANEGDILISVRAPVGPTNLCPSKSCIGRGLAAIRPLDNISSKFVLYLLRNKERKIANEGTGTTFKAISRKVLENLNVFLPPLAEQHRIVAKIEELFSELDNGVAQLKQVQAQLKSYRQSVLKHAFEGKLTEAYRSQPSQTLPPAQELLNAIRQERKDRHRQALKDWQQEVIRWAEAGKVGKKPGKPKAHKELPPLTDEEVEKLPVLPEGWVWVRLGNTIETIFDGPFGSNLKTDDYVEEGIRVIRLENIGYLEFNESKKTFISEEKYRSLEKHTVYSGDIVFSSFIADNIRCVVLPNSIDKAINKADCFCIRNNNGLMSQIYLAYLLSARQSYKNLSLRVHGATRPKINTTQLKELSIPLCSTEEQHQIVQEIESRLSVAEHLERTVEESLRQAEVLRQSILQRAFTGQLVPQDPNDEPAVELLKRIQEEKSGGKKKAVEAKASGMQTDEQLSITF